MLVTKHDFALLEGTFWILDTGLSVIVAGLDSVSDTKLSAPVLANTVGQSYLNAIFEKYYTLKPFSKLSDETNDEKKKKDTSSYIYNI